MTSDIVVVDIEQILDTLQDIALDPQPLVAIEQARTTIQSRLQAVWDQAESLPEEQRATAVLAGQRDQYADELSELSDAVIYHDTDNPYVAELVDEVEKNTMSWYGDMVDENITEAAIKSLMPIDGATHTLIRRFLDRLIRQDGEWTDEQEFLLAGLLGSFADERDAVRVRR